MFYSLCLWRGEEEKREKNLQTNTFLFFREERRFLSSPPSSVLDYKDKKRRKEMTKHPFEKSNTFVFVGGFRIGVNRFVFEFFL